MLGRKKLHVPKHFMDTSKEMISSTVVVTISVFQTIQQNFHTNTPKVQGLSKMQTFPIFLVTRELWVGESWKLINKWKLTTIESESCWQLLLPSLIISFLFSFNFVSNFLSTHTGTMYFLCTRFQKCWSLHTYFHTLFQKYTSI